MCGIVGYAGFKKKIPLDIAIEKIHHRGPDDNGVAYFDGIALGSTRLAIIDLSPKGHQPMFTNDKSLCIVFNGEIYNFKEIKKMLEEKYEFKSNSDTEVILYAYKEWGPKCLEKLNGMFSFVVYDLKKKLLFGARDRLGQKPLKYFFKNGTLIFASEIKAILSLLDSKPEIDEIAIDDFLTLQYVPTPATGFKDIYKLPAAHYFIYQDKKLSIRKYWSLNFTKKLTLLEDEWCELVFSEIERSVKSHLISDVSVGVLLSGGLDSSIVVALMAKNSSRRINTFSIGFDDDRFDETRYAKQVSEMYKTTHTQFTVTSRQLLEHVSNLAQVFDEPIGDNSILPTLLLSKLTGSKVKVALTGDGGDENFAGYDRYTFVVLSHLISRFPTSAKKIFQLSSSSVFMVHKTKFTERMDRFLSTLDQKFYRRYINYNCFFTNKSKQELYSDDFKKLIGNNDTYQQYFSIYDKKLSDLDNALKIDINTYLPDDLLYKSDSASMAYGLELRSPFLDHILMEKVASMPSDIKLKFITKKKILKEIAIKNKLLPKEIIYRSKQGFTIPQNKWFKGPLKKYINDQILSSSMNGTIFERRKMKSYLDDYFKGKLNYDNNIFALLTLSLWFDKYFN
ncbi:MAG: asparagine synthase (glutamine-hydrolyzing) [Candidatus Levybacteria bacterium RIFCSPHIGHO2_12_FULL_38_12]|nr:MAG: asparagine synthase (glutamine-hydrolyzing) [Candidatus Levybacteria bacterium RIFCSPHIGHO2_01_FULL_38_12]OGH21746.1 MAG: asparagine synthase (glutamine-hydrolyzing) [Candidatus Levybacteria bacterium RIFCSPHIGHO2_02_FULL_37_18]OGH22596.1 MAG: asparagine synthase (glutamine-hydrolyzing) [Candidatus Levybacteria bacterium RIFCSPHIGHO2_12_FULL_38_12]OGH33367.1 MAG: asparagine synthase (glutamine-hydrolyzing) [Candidatus Levybacteria bacterium RIFCSPLOWO2_01_FULL_37_20]OGH44134.1 MAG: aspa